MPQATHFIITNRQITNIEGKEFVPVGNGEYINCTGRETAGDDLRFGEVSFDDTKKNNKLKEFKINIYPDLPYDEQRENTLEESLKSAKKLSSYKLFESLRVKQRSEKDEKNQILFFIHGYKNDLEAALGTMSELHNKYVKPENSPIKHIVMFTWPSRRNLLTYRDDARDAQLSGYALARSYMKLRDYFKIIIRDERKELCKAKINLLAHSMGNKVLESMIDHLERENKAFTNLFEEGILAGADIDYDSFTKPKPMYKLIDLCSRIHIYYHREDKALMVSETTKNAFNRLGIWGIKDTIEIPDDVYQSNVTYIEDEKKWFLDIFNGTDEKLIHHWYYVKSDTVVADIIEVLNGNISAFADEF
ncbi:alpha/beta hydrolase [Marinigracilibium pacificum]|uniref:Alpha/beta hydrolase n=1 Tax=Marinigracilibium pacificum TaxID=2729599 RepID=A0A848IS54_9BACT|nr:alpha/beta hydrolase [Marinigracilibium pacificum]NMM47283.1 alpha/beta hydrolase [Marinigracilibium pacificum]